MAARRAGARACRRCRSSRRSRSTTATRRRSNRSACERFHGGARRGARSIRKFVIAHARVRAQHGDARRGEVRPARAPASPRSSSVPRARHRRRSAFTPARRSDDDREAAAERVAAGDRARAGAACRRARRACSSRTPRARAARSPRPPRRSARSSARAEGAARAHRLRARHLPPVRVGLRSARVGRRRIAVLDEFEEATGEPPGFFHLNDSEGALGSNGIATR